MKGTRIPVHQVVHMLASGESVEDLLAEYPSLCQEDILACLDYAASLAEEQVKIESLLSEPAASATHTTNLPAESFAVDGRT